MKSKTNRLRLLHAALFACLSGLAQAQTPTLGEAAADAVDSSISTVSPILAVVLGFSILVGMIFAFTKKR